MTIPMRILYATLCFLFCSTFLFSQGFTLTAPSAVAGGFGKYGDIPVSPYTGTTHISIPIATVNDGPLSHAVSLGYHTAGNRVTDATGMVGLGWHLNGGGIISRTVQSIADDHYLQKGYISHAFELDPSDPAQWDDIDDRERDSEPDVFSYSVGSYSGKFYFNGPDIVQVPETDLDIIPVFTSTLITGFRIFAPDGTLYEFGDESGSSVDYRENVIDQENEGNASLSHISSWMLRKITSYDGEHTLSFEYQKYTADQESTNHCVTVYDGTNDETETICNETDLKIATPHLEKITGLNNTLVFHYETFDINGQTMRRLKEVVHENTYTCIKTILTHDHFTDNAVYYRNKLDKVRTESCNGEEILPPYILDYYSVPGAPVENFFPKRNDLGIDHWGYYNAYSSNPSLTPPTSVENANGESYFYGSAYRESRFSSMLQGMLQKMTYPTGGHVALEYQANTYERPNNETGNTRYLQINNEHYPEEEIEIDEVILNNGKFSLWYLSVLGDCTQMAIVATDVETGQEVDNYAVSGTAADIEDLSLSAFFPNLQAGKKYRFSIDMPQAGYPLCIARFGIYDPNSSFQFCGDLSIKKIIVHDGNNTDNDIVKTYHYIEEDGETYSGNLFNIPVYGASIDIPVCPGAIFYSSSVQSLTSFQGNHIGFSRVEEHIEGNGKIVYNYRKENEASPSQPFVPPVYRGIDGIMDVQKVYNEDDELKTESSNTLHPGDDYTFPTYAMFKMLKIPFPGICDNSVQLYNYEHRTCHTRLESQTVISDGVTTTTEYDYDATDRFYAPISMRTTDSEGKEHRTDYKRMIDYDYNGQNFSLYILSRNMILPVWKTEKFVNGILVDGSIIQHDMVNNNLYPIAQHRYEMTWDEIGNPTGAWDKVLDIDNYQSGIARKTTRRGWVSQHITLTGKRIKLKSTLTHTTIYNYYNDSPLLQSLTAVDGTSNLFIYDDLGRLEIADEHCSDIIKTYDRIYDTDPSDGINHVLSTTTSYPFVHQDSEVTDITAESHVDGLGREMYSILKNQSPHNQDQYLSREYDNVGRVVKTYNMAAIPFGTEYTETIYEKGGQGRILSTTPPEWYATTLSYGFNDFQEVYNHESNSFYTTGDLYKTTSTDPDGNKMIVFTDKAGRKVLSRKVSPDNSESSDTHYLYDDKGRLTTVLPPATTPSDTELIYVYRYDERDNIIYKKLPDSEYIEYRYNNRDLLAYMQDGNMRADGKWYATRYDDLGRETKSGFYTGTPPDNLSFAQATISELLTENIYGTTTIEKDKIKTVKTKILNTSDWLNTTYFYDACGRLERTESNHHLNLNNDQAITEEIVLQDWMGNILLKTTEQNINGYSTSITDRYTYDHVGRQKNTYITLNNETEKLISILNYNEENEMDQKKLGGLPSTPLQQIDYTYNAQGLLRSINEPIEESANDPPCGASSSSSSDQDVTDIFHLELKYDESVTSTPTYLNGNISSILWQVRGKQRKGYGLEYDYQNRLTRALYGQYNFVTFDETEFYSTAYSYDERGNMQTLHRRQQSIEKNAEECYTKEVIDDLTYYYKSGSNQLDRVEDEAPCPDVLILPQEINHDAVYAAAEKVIAQITDIDCRANVSIYTGNALEITESLNIKGDCMAQTEVIKSTCPTGINFSEGFHQSSPTGKYLYNANGNLMHDPNKNINITNNHLNLPEKIEKQESPAKEVFLQYDAGGNLLYRETRIDGQAIHRRDYAGRIEYKNSAPENISHDEGRITKSELGHWQYEYVLADHLGNARIYFADLNNDGTITVDDDPAISEILQESHYYPFGLEMKGFWQKPLPANHNNYNYNSIEYIDALGLNVNMATFRTLDPTLARWWQVDPKAEAVYGMSPYQSMGNSPMVYADPEGDLPFLAVVGIGAAFGGIMGGVQNGWEGVWKGALAGGIGAAAGAGAVAAWGVGGVGFYSGAVNGAIGGAVGGFAGGASGAWLNGASFTHGLKAGGIGAGIGGLSGGVIGGLDSGFKATRYGGDFWSGEGATFYNAAGATITGKKVRYSNESARSFSKRNFSDISTVDNLYADGREGIGVWEVTPDQMYGVTNDGIKILGYTRYNGFRKGSDVYLYKAAFSSPEQLYLTMGHEYIHANLLAAGKPYGPNHGSINSKKHHALIYNWEKNQAAQWGFSNANTRYAANYARQFASFRNSGWEKYLIPLIKHRPR